MKINKRSCFIWIKAVNCGFLGLFLVSMGNTPAKANLIGNTLGWQYYAYGGPYGGASGTFNVSGTSFTTVGATFTDFLNATYFNIVANPTSITFDYSPNTKSTGTIPWSPSDLSLAPTIHNGIAINMLSGSPFKSVKIDPATNMAGFGSSNISFTGSQIQVDWQNLPFNSSTIVKLDVNTGQTVFLDFAQDTNARYNLDGYLFDTTTTYTKPDSGQSSAQITQVLSTLQSIYSNYNVDFTTSRPASGPYETVYIGGTSANIPNSNLPNGVLGVAQSINIMDSNPYATAVVFSGHPSFSGPGATSSLAQVIAHETGHLLGLQHVTQPTELMYPFASSAATGISSSNIPVGLIDSAGQVVPTTFGFTQNSDSDLLCAVGSSAGASSCLGADSLSAFKLFLSSFSTIYDAKFVVLAPGDPSNNSVNDTGVAVENLGTIQPGVEQFYYLPAYPGERFILAGSSMEGGATDIFVGGENGFSGDLTDPNTFALQLFTNSGELATSHLVFYQMNSDGSFTNLGIGTIGVVPEPAGYATLLAGLGLIGFLARRSKTANSGSNWTVK